MNSNSASNVKQLVLATVVVASVVVTTIASATTLPAASIGSGVGNTQFLSGPGTATATSNDVCGYFSGCTGTATASASYSGGVATASFSAASSGIPAGYSISGGASISYGFEVIGPANPSASLFFSASGVTSATGNASVNVGVGEGLTLLAEACSASGIRAVASACGGLSSSFSGSYHFTVPTNTLETATLNIGGIMAKGGGGFSASFDPSITLDPSLAGKGYSVIVSPDPVPLPASAWLLLSGLGGLGAMVRRRTG